MPERTILSALFFNPKNEDNFILPFLSEVLISRGYYYTSVTVILTMAAQA
jgi:hypothetical protein